MNVLKAVAFLPFSIFAGCSKKPPALLPGNTEKNYKIKKVKNINGSILRRSSPYGSQGVVTKIFLKILP